MVSKILFRGVWGTSPNKPDSGAILQTCKGSEVYCTETQRWKFYPQMRQWASITMAVGKKAHRLQLMSCFSSESIKMLLVANNEVSETISNCSVIRGRKYRVGWDSEWEGQQLLGVLGVQVFFKFTLLWLGLVSLTDGCDKKTSVTSTHGVKGKKRNLPREKKKKTFLRKTFSRFPLYFIGQWAGSHTHFCTSYWANCQGQC